MTDPQPSARPLATPSSGLTPTRDGHPGSPAVMTFYLPQYHQIPENDEWWGEGFTDWAKVAAARPLYTGHLVPYVPAELGAYDLRSREARAGQAELARSHGVYGFCYYFYWFSGRRLLEQPLELMLADGEPGLPFCLCWANEPWTRRWDGREGDVLMAQHHDRTRDLAILDDLMPYFVDERYIRIDGRPLLLVYRQNLLADAVGFASDLRAEAVRRGLPGLYLCNVMSISDVDRRAEGFDAAVEFPPHGTLGREIDPRSLGAAPTFRGRIYDFASVVQTAISKPAPAAPHFPGVMPRWDNSARKGLAAHIFHGSSPELFEVWLRRAAGITSRRNPEAPLVFVNSWNEWAEGAHLEPDGRTGRGYLEVIQRVVSPPVVDSPDDGVEARRMGGVDDRLIGDESAPFGPHREATLRRGMPDGASEPVISDGVAQIEEVDDRPLRGGVIPVGSDRTLRIRGWFYGDSGYTGRQRDGRYLILSATGSAWHAPISERHSRADVLRGRLATSQRSRKLMRALDRLPAVIAQGVLFLWSGGRDRVGFDVRVHLADLPNGLWDISFAERSPRRTYLVTTDWTLDRTPAP